MNKMFLKIRKKSTSKDTINSLLSNITKIDIKKSQCDLSSRGVKIHLSELGL